ncbi:MAG: hypothetical protein D6743_11695, partial [Calditrichaeota bacterium]
GKVGTSYSFPVLRRLFQSEKSRIRAEAALSVGRMALRNLTDSSVTAALTRLLSDRNAEVRWRAAYALMRIGKNLNVKALRRAVRDKDARVRMQAIRALGNLRDYAALDDLGRILNTDPDWRVRVQAANALGNFPLAAVADYFSLFNQTPHVRHAIIEAIGSSAKHDSTGYRPNSREINFAKNQLEQLIRSAHEDSSFSATEVGLALISYAQLMGKDALDLVVGFAEHPEPRLRARAMQALGEIGAAGIAKILASHYDQAPSIVKIAILNALTKLRNVPSPTLYLRALQEKDEVLVALAADGLSRDSLKYKIYAPRIREAYQRLPKPLDTEVAQMIFQAMARFRDDAAVPLLQQAAAVPDKAYSLAAVKAVRSIVGTDSVAQVAAFTKPHADFHFEEIRKLQGATATIETRYGSIKIKLFTEDAPLTVLNFARLARKGFFDGLTFHRVVPNFVIQGGDPRGDSWGSPGYSIRSEFNKHPYLRGTVGMASAGKDTEGCQFFITHSAQPHLDGRYTVFGQVVSGMDVVDAIQENDVMQKVTINE